VIAPLNSHGQCGYLDLDASVHRALASDDDGEIGTSVTAEQTGVNRRGCGSWLWRRQLQAYPDSTSWPAASADPTCTPGSMLDVHWQVAGVVV